MEVGLLGPVTIPVRAGVVAPGKRARALLAVLVLAGPDPLPTREVAQRVWGNGTPADADSALQGLLDQLAAVLPEGAVQRTASGHHLVRTLVSSDVDRFVGLVAAAAAARTAGDPHRAVDLLAESLATWRGAALDDVRVTPHLVAEATRLDEARITAVEDRCDLTLHWVGHEGLVDELRQLVEVHPTRERLWALLMTALYRSGRGDEAIEVYAEARERLADELGIAPGEALQQLEAGILRNDPVLGENPGAEASVRPRPRARIPLLTSPTYGRDDLIRAVGDLLGRTDVRLVTLTGIGGSGKSRIATLVATAAEDSYTDVAYLQVTEGTTRHRLAVDVALTLGCEPGGDPCDALTELGPERRALVVLDNLEALPEGAALVVDLLGASEALTLLVTSRLPLNAVGEHELPVPPLDVPDPAGAPVGISASASVRLFVERAVAAEPSFELTGQEYDVAEVCRLLDGLPLAIELAAARVKLRSLNRIIEGLRTGLDLLSTGSAGVPERQQAMDSVIRWSYERLDPAARVVCDRLALFERGFTIEAVEAICPDVPGVIEALTSIVDARLMRSMESRVEVRFVVLGTVRAFARERLMQRADLARSRELLAGHLTSQVISSATRLYGPDADLTLARFDDDAADIASAIDWALAAGRRDVAVELTLASLDCWVSAGRHNEALARTRRVLEHVPQQGEEAARLHAAVALLAYHLTDFDEAQTHSRLALELAERHADRRSAAVARTFLGATLVFGGEIEEGRALAERALVDAEALDLYPLSTQALSVLAIAMGVGGDYDGERRAHEARLAVVRSKGDLARTADTLNTLAEIALDEADGETARAFAAESLAIAEPRLPMESRDAAITLARAALVLGELTEAATKLTLALQLSDRLGQSFAVAQCLRVGGCLAAAGGDDDAAVRLFGAARTLSPSPGGSDYPPEQDLAAGLAEARHSLGEKGAQRAWTLGSSLPLAAARAQLEALLQATPAEAAP